MKKNLALAAQLLGVFLMYPASFALRYALATTPPTASFGRMMLAGSILGAMPVLAVFTGIVVTRRLLGGTEVLDAAHTAALTGQLDEAERLLATLDPRRQSASRRRRAALVRATIHYLRGEIDQALVEVDTSIAGPLALLESEETVAMAARARGLRAVLRAATGDAVGARKDIMAAQKGPSDPEARARATLAQGMLLDRAGEGEQARAYLGRERGLLLANLSPAERAMARGLLRKPSGTPSSAYRHRSIEPSLGEEALAAWVSRLSPGAAQFMAPPRPARIATAAPFEIELAATEAGRAAAAAVRAVPSRFKHRNGEYWRSLVLIAAVIGASVAVSILARRLPAFTREHTPALLGLLGILYTAFMGLAISTKARATRRNEALRNAELRLDRGNTEGLRPILEGLAAVPSPDVAALAEHNLARLTWLEGDLPGALAACDRGLGHVAALDERIASARKVSVSYRVRQTPEAHALAMVGPRLTALRASVLAALGRSDEAAGEIALLPEVDRAITLDRVRIFNHLRTGDLDGAAQVVAQRAPGLRIEVRDEALSDLVVAAASASEGELEALQEEIAADRATERWIRGVAPELLVRRAEPPRGTP